MTKRTITKMTTAKNLIDNKRVVKNLRNNEFFHPNHHASTTKNLWALMKTKENELKK